MNKAFLFAAAALVVGAGSVSAQSGEINHHARIGHALRQGCAIQHVHTPAGKTVHAPPIVRCSGAKAELAARSGPTDRHASAQDALGGLGSR